MAIEEPRINVALTTNNGRTSILIRRSDADDAKPDEPLRWVSLRLTDIEKEGHVGVCQRIGAVVLGLLAGPHAALLEQHPLLMPPLPEPDDLQHIVISLINRSIREKTSAYVPALDAIFVHNPAELAQTNMPEQWPTFRQAISRF
jgi:hypothetical protein